MPVNRAAIDQGERSLQHSIARFRPHLVLSLGLAPSNSWFRVERQADTWDLAENGGPPDRLETWESGALAHAIRLGAALLEGAAPPELSLRERR